MKVTGEEDLVIINSDGVIIGLTQTRSHDEPQHSGRNPDEGKEGGHVVSVAKAKEEEVVLEEESITLPFAADDRQQETETLRILTIRMIRQTTILG